MANVVFTKEQWEDLIKSQWDLNLWMNGETWILGKTRLGKPISWNLAMKAELAELANCFPWKHWKGTEGSLKNDAVVQAKKYEGPIDRDNVNIEIVDILHFLLSSLIYNLYDWQLKKNGTSATLKDILAKVKQWDLYPFLNKEPFTSGQNLFAQDDSMFTESVLEVINDLYDTSYDYNWEYAEVLRGKLTQQIELFSQLVNINGAFGGCNVDETYKLYKFKYILNKFRKENGYLTGAYIKTWSDGDGVKVEDNKILINLFKQGVELKDLENELKTFYRKVFSTMRD